MFKPEERTYVAKKWKVAKDIDTPEDHYMWLTTNPFTDTAIKSSTEIKDGKRGSIFTRTMNKIWEVDPLNSRDYESILTGDLYKELEYANRLILGESAFEINRMTDLMPRILRDTKNIKGSILYLKRTIAQLSNQSHINEKLRSARMDGLNKVIKEKITKTDAKIKDTKSKVKSTESAKKTISDFEKKYRSKK